jgi:hypothetical protein
LAFSITGVVIGYQRLRKAFTKNKQAGANA